MDNHYIITISHMIGCGGAEVGQRLSKALSIPFVDRQILKQVSDYLNLPESDLQEREERLVSFWEQFFIAGPVGTLTVTGGEKYLPSDRELFELESKFIKEIAQKGSAIILGRGSMCILRDFPKRFSIFVYAEMEDRIKRVSELYNISRKEAIDMINQNDRDRENYMKTFTKIPWLDLRMYDLCINTSSVGFDNAVKCVIDGINHKLKIK
ncbi:MAG: AAA family ATPase [Athalassotoga sp.]|uniref:cytidylate kinase-like family protein n=1 Tax=Athalassotoga sp. TaxID=2022597 RepID=UPI003D01EBDD